MDIAELEARFKFFESFNLDPKIYGVTKIPLKMYEQMLHIRLSTIRKGVRKRILWVLEDRHAKKQLDRLLPGWKRSRVLTRRRADGNIRIRPATLLRNARAIIRLGKKPTVDALIRYSIETIAKGTGSQLIDIGRNRKPTIIQRLTPEEDVSRLLHKGEEVDAIAKKTGIPLEEVDRIRGIRRVVFEHLQKSGAWLFVDRDNFENRTRTFTSKPFSTNSLGRIFKTREDWETAVRMAGGELNVSPQIMRNAIDSLATAIRKQGGYAPKINKVQSPKQGGKAQAAVAKQAEKQPSTFREMMSTTEGRQRARMLIMKSGRPEAEKSRLLARADSYEPKKPQKSSR